MAINIETCQRLARWQYRNGMNYEPVYWDAEKLSAPDDAVLTYVLWLFIHTTNSN